MCSRTLVRVNFQAFHSFGVALLWDHCIIFSLFLFSSTSPQPTPSAVPGSSNDTIAAFCGRVARTRFRTCPSRDNVPLYFFYTTSVQYGRPSVIQPVGVDQGGSLKPYQRGLWRDDEQGGDTTPLSVSLPESFDRFSRPFKGGIVAQREGVIEIAFYFYLALNDDRESKRQYLKWIMGFFPGRRGEVN